MASTVGMPSIANTAMPARVRCSCVAVMLQCVAVCCSCVAVCCSVLQCVAVRGSVWQCESIWECPPLRALRCLNVSVAVVLHLCCIALQLWCSVLKLHCSYVSVFSFFPFFFRVLQYVGMPSITNPTMNAHVCCSCVAVC